MIVFWFFFDFDFVIVCCLWWKVEFGDGLLVVFENGLVVGSGCFFFGVEGAKITFLPSILIFAMNFFPLLFDTDFFYYLFHRLFYFVHFIMCVGYFNI